ncbi:DUB-associated factor 1 [Candida tropicalis]
MILPRWVGQPILYNKHPVKESPKLTFQLTEVDYSTLPPNFKIGGKSQKKIKKLPDVEGSIKLTSHNMLRVSKILSYLTDKFESSTKEMKDKKLKPADWLVLECRGQELTYDMTLQTIKTKIWKSGSDIELTFRRKYD